MALSKAELACVYAALVLVDDDVAVTVSIGFSFETIYHMAQHIGHVTHTQRRVCVVCRQTTCVCILISGSSISSKTG